LRFRILAAAVAAAVVAALVTWIALSVSSFGDDFWTSTVGSDGVKVFVLRGDRIIRVFSLWFLFVFAIIVLVVETLISMSRKGCRSMSRYCFIGRIPSGDFERSLLE